MYRHQFYMKVSTQILVMEICVAFQTLKFEVTFLNKESVHIGVNYILIDRLAIKMIGHKNISFE